MLQALRGNRIIPKLFRQTRESIIMLAAPRFQDTTSSILVTVKDAIGESRKAQDEVSKLSSVSFENTVKRLAQIDDVYEKKTAIPLFYQHISTKKDIRDASSQAELLNNEFSIESAMRVDLYKQVEKVFAQNPMLDDEDKRLLEKTRLSYVRKGLGLPEQEREQLKGYYNEISNLCVQFSKNLGEVNSGVWFTRDELEGIPQSLVETFEEKDGKFKMEFKYPSLLPTLKYAKAESTRRRAFIGDQNRVPENIELLEKAVLLRSKAAKLLGYSTHADFILDDAMAKSSPAVSNFLKDLQQRLTGKGKEEAEVLRQLKGEKELYLWDYRYYDRMLVESKYAIDEEKISEYFSLEPTYRAMFNIFSVLFGLQFQEIKEDRSVWHEDCKQFAVDESNGKDFVGWLYLDLHPRDGKYGHAASFCLQPSYLDSNDSRVYPTNALVCNFTKPTSKKPSLLKQSEVVTLFHELGHGIHSIVARTRYSRFHGTNTATDFVECPSQLLENWCWTEDVLVNMSSHYETGETLPRELARSLIDTKHANDALFNLRQLHLGIFDQTLHSYTSGEVESTKLYNKLRGEIALLEDDHEQLLGHAAFGHLMGGYDARYYGYLWSKVFASDLWATTFAASPLDSNVGFDYRKKILERGGSKEESSMLTDFLGREPNNKAFLAELGISPSKL